ncbi:carbohydrate ABC transporter permease [Microbacterium sp. MAHUQ-60]|uniref:carbohydrate ABC transporter permease n=1 Tax=unclassified Microbacterium TaxID=2609290 RepID=UPI0036098B2A
MTGTTIVRPRRGPRLAGVRPPRWHSRVSTPYLLIAPTMILLVVLFIYPIINVVALSLQSYNLAQPWDDGFVGIDNFVRMAGDAAFWQSLWVTFKWVVVEVGLQLVFGLILALIVNETFIGRGLARALIFSPWAVSGVLTTTIWLLLYNPGAGLVGVLANLGAVEHGVSPLAGTESAFWAAVVAELWRGVPFFAILILADLQSVPKELHEAAEVDGANSWKRFLHITLPHLRNAIVLATLLRGVWEFNNVDLLYTLTGGGPAGATTTLPLLIANTAIRSNDFGYGSALTVVGFVILAAVTVVYLRLTGFGKED